MAELMGLGRDHARLVSALERAVAWAEDPASFEARDAAVSHWSVGEHLEHLLLANRGMVDWLGDAARGKETRPTGEAGGSPGFWGWLVLLTGFIPRGRGQAPDMAVPEGRRRSEVAEGLAGVLEDARCLGGGLDAIRRSEARMTHPALGTLDAAQWLRFARIHHRHHEKIVRDLV